MQSHNCFLDCYTCIVKQRYGVSRMPFLHWFLAISLNITLDCVLSVKFYVCEAYVCEAYVCEAYVCEAYVCESYVCEAYVCEAYVCEAYVCEVLCL